MNHIGDTNKMVSDTPRMKAAQMAAMEHGTGDVYRVGCDIERELNAAHVEIERLTKKVVQLYEGAEEQNDRIKRLEEWKESAMAVEREWDANAISTMLGGQLGESQRVVIMREVPRLLERIKRLEDAGDAVEKKLGCGCGCYGLCKACQSASDNWLKARGEAKP